MLAVLVLALVVNGVRQWRHGSEQGRCAVYDAQGLPLPQSCLEDQSWR